MLHARFTITWPDGQHATSTLHAESPEQNFPVEYSGAYHRLIAPPTQADVSFLAFVMRETAEKTGGSFSEDYTGQYDRQAGGAEGL